MKPGKTTRVMWIAMLALFTMALMQPVSAALFTQDFSSSTVVGDYIDATTPTANQLTLVNGGTTSIDAGRLKVVKAAGAGGNVRRWVAMEGTPVGGMSFSYDMNIVVAAGYAANTRLITGVIGQPAAGQNWLAWGIDATGVADEWNVTGDTTHKFTGSQTVTLFLNDSASAFDYTDPVAGMQTLASNSYDVWVGTTLVADGKTDVFVHPEYDLTTFSIGLQKDPAATYYFDNFNVQAIPEPATLGMVGFIGAAVLFARRWLVM